MIKIVKFKDICSDKKFHSLIVAYENEVILHSDFPKSVIRPELYQQLEDSGSLTILGVYLNDVLVGFASILFNHVPHYQELLAVVESIYLDEKSRNTGLGVRLIKVIEAIAQDRGADVLMLTSTIGGKLTSVADKLNYTQKNIVHYKILSKKGVLT